MAKKSYTKRIRVTKTGKLLRRKQGLGHNRAKRTGNATRLKHNLRGVSRADLASIKSKLN